MCANHITHLIQAELPLIKLCECGCGQPAPLAKRSNSRLGHVKGQPLRFISGHNARLRPKRSIKERFWEKVDKRGPDECWEWQGALTRKGYGQLGVDGKIIYAHRVSYELHNGSISADMYVLHKCNNRPCCNPDHLYQGTAQDNYDDMVAAGNDKSPPRRAGERHGRARFANEQVRELRNQFAKKDVSVRKFARLHNIPHTTMRHILGHKTYQNV